MKNNFKIVCLFFVPSGGELIDERASRLTASIKAITAEVKADPSWEGMYYFYISKLFIK